jgi:hypothetical protein
MRFSGSNSQLIKPMFQMQSLVDMLEMRSVRPNRLIAVIGVRLVVAVAVAMLWGVLPLVRSHGGGLKCACYSSEYSAVQDVTYSEGSDDCTCVVASRKEVLMLDVVRRFPLDQWPAAPATSDGKDEEVVRIEYRKHDTYPGMRKKTP